MKMMGIDIISIGLPMRDEADMAKEREERDSKALALGLSCKKPLEDRRYAEPAGQDKTV